MFQVIDLYGNGRYSIGLTTAAYDLLYPQKGSYQVFAARVYGLSYPYFLLLMINKFNGIVETNERYGFLYFPKQEDCQKVVNELNKRVKNINFIKEKDIG